MTAIPSGGAHRLQVVAECPALFCPALAAGQTPGVPVSAGKEDARQHSLSWLRLAEIEASDMAPGVQIQP
jgi:hypothetical protein